MTNCDLIVYERSGRWARTIRVATRRQILQFAGEQPIYEVRSLEELTARLDESPRAVALVEVRPMNLADTLTWLADARPSHPRARCVALLDSHQFDNKVRDSVAEALLAAGTVGIIDSPRHLQPIVVVARRHAASQVRKSDGLDEGESFGKWAWDLLPWQPA